MYLTKILGLKKLAGLFIKIFLKKVKCDLIYSYSSKNLSIVKKDNPNLTRLIFKTL